MSQVPIHILGLTKCPIEQFVSTVSALVALTGLTMVF